ncbi:hypothetical protein MTR_4g111700 [Medicago truncatula]|uniref:Uncharacterized protein n=1 Tax=Medicago truncatula TaxID=3880 RepID=G7JS10_MEDTR|nr:hypothetical protein MTR_4g111700 [Medicago truncatula]
MGSLPLQGWSKRSFENSREGRGETSQFSLTIDVKWKCSNACSVEEPHQSISNLVVKLYCGDDTIGEIRNSIQYISTISIHFFSQVIYILMQTYAYTSIYY